MLWVIVYLLLQIVIIHVFDVSKNLTGQFISVNRSLTSLGLVFLNIQGLNNKISVLESFLINCGVSIVCLSEHWLIEEEISLAFPNGFYCAAAFSRKDHIRGGTAVFIQNHLTSKELNVNIFCKELHFEASAVLVDNLDTIIVSIYHSPNGDSFEFLNILESFLAFISQWKQCNILIGGDYNEKFDVTKNSKTAKYLLNIFRQFNFYHLITTPTRGSNCLDNIFVYNKNLTIPYVNTFKFPFSDHDGILVKTELISKLPNVDATVTKPNVYRLKFHLPEKNINSLILHLASIDWPSIILNYNCGTTDMFLCVFNILLNSLNYHRCLIKVKESIAKNRNKYKHDWFTDELASMKERLLFFDKLVKLHKNQNNFDLKEQYRKLKGLYKKSINNAKFINNVNFIESKKNKCKAAWEIIKVNTQGSMNNKINIAPDVLNNYFIDSVRDIKNKTRNQPCTGYSEFLSKTSCNSIGSVAFNWSFVTVDDVLNAAKRMSASDSLDYYNMSNNLLKKIIVSFAEPLAVSINQLLKNGNFPDELKISRVCPIYKNGPKDQSQSYRPISVVPVLGKLIELLVYDQIYSFLENHNILNQSQFGFRKGKSTLDALDNLIRQIHSSFENKTIAQATFCDLSKAFDCVEKEILIKKLEYYGFTNSSSKFFRSYLTNRRQVVQVNGEWSNEVKVRWGVPQGTVLGPLLFLIYINDLPFSIDSKTILYADDTTFINISKDTSDLDSLTSETLIAASDWFYSNGFLLNEDKTKNIIFSLKRKSNTLPINFTDTIKFLGLTVDDHLTWNSHIDYLSIRLSRVVYLLKRLQSVVPENYIKTAYYSYFQSIFRYGLILFGNCPRIGELLTIQKKVVRNLTNSDIRAHCQPLFIDLQIQTIVNLYIFDLTIYVCDNPNLLNFKYTFHNYNTRTKNNTEIDFHRLSKTHNSHIVMSLRFYNFFESKINCFPPKQFKQKLYTWLLKHPFYCIDDLFQTIIVDF